TSILEWAVDKNGRPRIKGTSSSSAKVLQSSWERHCFRQNAPVLHVRYCVLTTSNTAAGQASKPSFLQDLTHLSDLYFQVILPCLVFDQDTKSFHCFVGRILALLLYIFLQVDRVHRTMYSKLPLKFFLLPFMGNLLYSEIAAIPLEVSVLLVLEDVPLCHFWEYSTIFWMSILASVAVLEVSAAGIKKRSKTYQRKDKDCLCDNYEIFLEDEEEFEAEFSVASTREIDVDPLVTSGTSEPTREDYPDMEILIGRILGIETAQRWLEAGHLIAGGERAGLTDREEFRQVHRDRDDTRRRLRRLESFVERRLGFRP
ncbi:hypothetical protein Tco_0947759, partial [Tanacetum coccineum]